MFAIYQIAAAHLPKGSKRHISVYAINFTYLMENVLNNIECMQNANVIDKDYHIKGRFELFVSV